MGICKGIKSIKVKSTLFCSVLLSEVCLFI